MKKIFLKDECTNETVTLEKAIQHIFEYELKEDSNYNSEIYNSINNLSIANSENYKEKLTLENQIKLAKYYDYELEKNN